MLAKGRFHGMEEANVTGLTQVPSKGGGVAIIGRRLLWRLWNTCSIISNLRC
jgi:hypothetical protein